MSRFHSIDSSLISWFIKENKYPDIKPRFSKLVTLTPSQLINYHNEANEEICEWDTHWDSPQLAQQFIFMPFKITSGALSLYLSGPA